MSKSRKLEIKPGDYCIDVNSGNRGIISDIQYVHNRYQFEDLSGWFYGVGNLVIVP